MLNFLRKKKIAKRILWVLAVIIIPAFVLWGAGSLTKRRFPIRHIGVIEGKGVSPDEFVKSLEDVRIGLFLNYFNQPQVLDKLQEDRKFINHLAWEQLMIKRGAVKDRTSVSDKEVVDFIARFPLFVRGGAFDKKIYEYILRQSLGMSPRAFEESVRNFLIIAKYKETIIKDVTVSDEELLQFYKNEFEKAKVRYIAIDKKNFKDKTKISDEEITSFYEKNKERFKEPERVILQYITFPHKEKGAKEKVMADLKRSYEKLRMRPRDMERVAASLNLTVDDTAPFSQQEIVPGIEAIKDIGITSFRLRPLTDIIPVISEDEIGTSYIIRVKEKVPSRIKSKDKVSPYIKNSLEEEKAMVLAEEEVESIYEKSAAENTSLKEAAKIHNLELRHSELVSRFDYIEGVGESYRIVEEAFKTGIGKISKPIETRKGFVLIEPVEFQSIDEEKFEKEKEDQRDKLLSAKKMKALEDWFAQASANSSLNVDLDRL